MQASFGGRWQGTTSSAGDISFRLLWILTIESDATPQPVENQSSNSLIGHPLPFRITDLRAVHILLAYAEAAAVVEQRHDYSL